MVLGMLALLACTQDWNRVGDNNMTYAHLIICGGFLGLFHDS